MSRRDTDRHQGEREREREKHRESDSRRAPPPPSSNRSHEYFVPRDGIDREVITADICRYLGNDALVRPGNYENPQTRQVQAGYFITAYRNLTTAMIADLKVDSERWETERRAASGGRPINGTLRDSSGFGRPSNTQPAPQYIGSRTQHERDYYGTSTEAPPIQPSSGYPAASAAGNIHTQGVFDGGYQGQHQPQQGYVQPSGTGPYGQQPPQGFPIHQEPQREYSFGANLPVDQRSLDPRNAGRVPVTQGGQIPRADVYSPSGSTPNYPSQDNRNPYNYSSQPPVSSSAQHYNQPTDFGYGRAPAPQYDTTMEYSDSRPSQYQDTSSFSQAPVSSTYNQVPMSSGFSQPPISAPSNPTIATGVPTSRRGDRDERRRDDRDGRHHRRP